MIRQVYDELRKLALAHLAREKPGQTLQATDLVNEVYLRMRGTAGKARWANRGHFWSAAAKTMQRILIDRARKKNSLKGGGHLKRTALWESQIIGARKSEQIVAVNEALERLEQADPVSARIVKLRFLSGMSFKEIAASMGKNRKWIYRRWTFARAWLFKEVRHD